MAIRTETNRPDLVRRAFRLEWFTAGWMLAEAAVAIGSGVAAHSLSLIAFGADSLIELASAGVLLWRLNVEMRQGAEFPASVEQRASRIGGVLLFALAAYVVGERRLWSMGCGRVRSSQGRCGQWITCCAGDPAVMWLLAKSAPGWWWVDSVISLAIVVLLVKEGREAWEG